MLRKLAGVVKPIRKTHLIAFTRTFSSRKGMTNTDETKIFPNEYEGNIYDDNWSLVEDGVVPVGVAFRNARVSLMTSAIGAKKGGSITAEKPLYFGEYSFTEAGDTISQEEFSDLFQSQKQLLSSGPDLFVEDASLGSYSKNRIGVRVVTMDATKAIIARTLLIPRPPRACNHRARFDGWNFDPRWAAAQVDWNGTSYEIVEPDEQASTEGERPITAFIGGEGSDVSVQFVENKAEKIVGANIVMGESAPVIALVRAIGHASNVVINEKYLDVLAVPSLSFTTVTKKGKEAASVVVINATDAMVDAAIADKGITLHGAYDNVLTASGVSALWNGVVSSTTKAGAVYKPELSSFAFDGAVPIVTVNDKAALPVYPDNLIAPVTHIAFFESGADNKVLSTEEGLERLVAMADASDEKAAVIAELLKGVLFSVVSDGSISDIA
jgi:hypothetical protein